MGKSLRRSTEREKAQRTYLETSGMTLTMLKQQVRGELIRQKGYDCIEQKETDKADAAAQERVSKIQAALEGGEDFGETAKKYSDDTGSSEQGGMIDQMISRGFFDQAFDDVVFDMNVGSISEPIKTEFGYQIVKLLDKKAAKGPAWEAAKPTLIEQLKKEKGPDYEPSEDELKKKYESVKIQHITIRTQAERETLGRIYWMTMAAERVIYDPMILAWRAVNTEPLCFPETELKDTTLEQLARDSFLQNDADLATLSEKVREFERVKLLRFQRAYGDPPEDIRSPFAEFDLEYGVEYEPEQAPEYPELDSLYPLGIGLVNRAIEIADKMADYHYAAAYIYSEWLDNDDALEMFPLDEEAARTEIEKELNEAIKLYENNGYYFAAAGMNYAKWVKPDQAREMLHKAEKFSSGDLDLLKLLTRAYRTNGDKEKGDEYQGKALDEQRRRWEQQQGSWTN